MDWTVRGSRMRRSVDRIVFVLSGRGFNGQRRYVRPENFAYLVG